jgi:hypothetical protein
MSDETLKRATEITVAAMANAPSYLIGQEAKVSAFFEVIARKIDKLQNEEDHS